MVQQSNLSAIFFKLRILALSLVFALLSGIQSASAGIIYDVFQGATPPFGVSISGTIETDGTIGAITASNIVSSDLKIAAYFNSGPVIDNLASLPTLLADVEATATELRFTSLGNDKLRWTGSGQTLWEIDMVNFGFGDQQNVMLRRANGGGSFSGQPGNVFATATAIPEPGSFACCSLFSLGILARRRRRS